MATNLPKMRNKSIQGGKKPVVISIDVCFFANVNL